MTRFDWMLLGFVGWNFWFLVGEVMLLCGWVECVLKSCMWGLMGCLRCRQISEILFLLWFRFYLVEFDVGASMGLDLCARFG